MKPDDLRLAGILVPAFSARHAHDLGIGDTRALRDWVDWAARYGIGFIQLLPINEHGSEESPYSAISSVALDPIYLTLDHDHLPWIEAKAFDKALQKAGPLKASSHVLYPQVRELKRNLLEQAWAHFDEAKPKLHKELAAFRKEEANWLDDYCQFRWLMEQHGERLTWDEWPADCQTPEQAHYLISQSRKQDPSTVDYRLGFFAFVQWLCFCQWRDLRAYADKAGVILMGDVPIGIARHSADVFFNRQDFHLDWCGGSPAEGHNPDNPFMSQWGQNWGIPLYRWDMMEANGFRWWHQRIARLREIFRIFRIDHILGFYRIYAFPWPASQNHRFVGLSHEQATELTGGRLPRWWQRPDDTPDRCHANRNDGDHRLKAILNGIDLSHVVAEDLGWVPYYVRPHLTELGIAGFKIPHWDCQPCGNPLPPDQFPVNAFACYSTHDHDPINTVWKACIHTIRHPQGLPPWQVDGAAHTIRLLCKFAGIGITDDRYPPYTEGVRLRLLHALLSSRSRLAAFMVTELFDIDERINEPGSSNHQNWSFRIPWTMNEIESSAEHREICRKLNVAISLSGRQTPPKKGS